MAYSDESERFTLQQQQQAILKEHLHNSLVTSKKTLGLSQKKMAQFLAMDYRSFCDLYQGFSNCSALTLVRFLIYCCNDPITFLVSLQVSFDAFENVKRDNPNIRKVKNALSYRSPFPVTEFRIQGRNVYSICPRCGITLDREYMQFCDRCGQQLDWSQYR